MRRVLTVLLLLAIISAAVWLLLNWERRVNVSTDPWRAIPSNSAVIISVPDAWSTWDRFTHTSQIWSAFEEIPSFAAAGKLMTNTVERMHEDAALRGALKNAPVLICMLDDGRDVGGLFIGTPNAGTSTPLGAFAELMGLDAAARNSLMKGEVVQIRPDTALPSLSLCLRDRTWLMATSTQVMDAALLQLKERSQLLNDSLFLHARGTVGSGADAHILIDLRKAARLLEAKLNNEITEDLYISDGWVAMDVRARPDAILMSGLLAPARDDNVLKRIREQGTGGSEVKRMLPSTVSVLEVKYVSDPREALLDPSKENDPVLTGALIDWVEGSVGRAWGQDRNGTLERWAFFQANDPVVAQESIMSVCDPEKCAQQDHRGSLIQQLPDDSLLIRMFGNSFLDLPRPWWTILGDMVIYSATPDALR
nr:hypothetical protein [Bacteroidota bacterium]